MNAFIECAELTLRIGQHEIGTAIARRALAFDMEVRAMRRTTTPSPIPDVEVVDSIGALVADAHHVVLAAPGTSRTRHLLDAGAFAATARLVAERFPGCEAWPDVVRLGRRLAPDEPLFADAATGGGQEAATGEADTPNWLEAPPDSAADAAAGEFRRRVLSTSPFAEAAKWR